MTNLVAVIILFAGVSSIGMATECNEKDLKQCFEGVKNSLKSHLGDLQNADKNSYCQALDRKGKCMTEVAENCKEKNPKVSKLVLSFYAYLNHMCTDNSDVFAEVTPCLAEHKSEFEKCEREETDDPMKDICRSVQSMKCIATLSEDLCDNGEPFGKALKSQTETLDTLVCLSSKSGFLSPNYWMLALIFLILFANRSKF